MKSLLAIACLLVPGGLAVAQVHSARRALLASALALAAGLPLWAASPVAPPYPPSPVIKEIVWAPVSAIKRAANDSDNSSPQRRPAAPELDNGA